MSATYFVKVGKKYVPVGHDGPRLYDGIWLVQSHKSGHSSKNIERCLKGLPDKKDLDILAKALQLEDDICNVLMDCWKEGSSCSIADAARAIAMMLAKKEKKSRVKRRKELGKKLTTKDIRRD